MEHQERRNRQIERAKAMVAQGPQDSTPQRGHTPVKIRNYVFQRDGGQYRVCESTVEVQFDHTHVKFGGSSGPENLQVLCARRPDAAGARRQLLDVPMRVPR